MAKLIKEGVSTQEIGKFLQTQDDYEATIRKTSDGEGIVITIESVFADEAQDEFGGNDYEVIVTNLDSDDYETIAVRASSVEEALDKAHCQKSGD